MRVITTRLLSVLAVIAQSVILDYYLISRNGIHWTAVIVADFVTIAVLIGTFTMSRRYFERYDSVVQDENKRILSEETGQTGNRRFRRTAGLLPFVYLAWFVYSCFLAMKIALIFKTFGTLLSGEEAWGTNLLEFVIAGTAGIFAFLIAGRERKPTPSQKLCLKFMQNHVMLEIIDNVEFLTILFLADHNLMLPTFVTDMILSFSCINFILPTLGLYQLSAQNFNQEKPRENFHILQTVLSTVFGNIPYLIIRIFLWTDHEFTNALFVMKNIIAICQNVVELIHYFTRDEEKDHKGKGKKHRLETIT